MKSLLKNALGGVAFLMGCCPNCWRELKSCNGYPCHVCNVAGYIKPVDIWRRFIQGNHNQK
jgi:hypothetical protein